jgi:signal transduction histidine kinase
VTGRGFDGFVRRTLGVSPSDLALAAGLAAFALLDVLLSADWRGPTVVNAVTVPSMALALAWRRRRPLLVLLAVMSGVVFLSLAYETSETWSYVFITVVAVYSSTAYGSNPLIAALLTASGVIVSDLRDPEVHTFGDAIWSSTLLGLAFLAGFSGWGLQRRSRALKRRARLLEEEEEERAAAAAAEERERIARELHDIVSHSLAIVVLQAGAAEQVLDRDPDEARRVLRSIRATGNEAVGEMSTMLGLVSGEPPAAREPQPTLADLDGLIERTREAGLPVDLSVEGHERDLPAALELSAYRIIQEGLTNALKHAGAAPTRVVLRYQDEVLEVEVSDDGAGKENGGGSRRGIAGIGERVAIFGGAFEAGTRADGGWTMWAALPLAQ